MVGDASPFHRTRFLLTVGIVGLFLSPLTILIEYVVDNFPPDFSYGWDNVYFVLFSILQAPIGGLIGILAAYVGLSSLRIRSSGLSGTTRRIRVGVMTGVASAACFVLLQSFIFDGGSGIVAGIAGSAVMGLAAAIIYGLFIRDRTTDA